MLFEGQLVIKDYSGFLVEPDRITIDEPSWMVKSSCTVGEAEKREALSLPGWAAGDVLSSMQSEVFAATVGLTSWNEKQSCVSSA